MYIYICIFKYDIIFVAYKYNMHREIDRTTDGWAGYGNFIKFSVYRGPASSSLVRAKS